MEEKVSARFQPGPEIPQAIQGGLIKVHIQGHQAEPRIQPVQGSGEEAGLYRNAFGMGHDGKHVINGGISMGCLKGFPSAAMIEALSMDCIRTARAKGLREKVVIYSHAWRNALLPVITLVIGWFLSIFSGSLMIENIFALNGIGKTYYDALQGNDNEVILALQMFYIALSLFGNLFIDIIYGFVDPRVRVNK